jgi:hypothetical protein
MYDSDYRDHDARSCSPKTAAPVSRREMHGNPECFDANPTQTPMFCRDGRVHGDRWQ